MKSTAIPTACPTVAGKDLRVCLALMQKFYSSMCNQYRYLIPGSGSSAAAYKPSLQPCCGKSNMSFPKYFIMVVVKKENHSA